MSNVEHVLDTKQQVLVALYTEYQKDLPDMGSVTHESLGIPREHFIIAIYKLLNEGYIVGAKAKLGSSTRSPLKYDNKNTMMTRAGIDYIEEKLDIDKTASSSEKVKGVMSKVALWGLDQLKDVSTKTLAEIANHQIDKYG